MERESSEQKQEGSLINKSYLTDIIVKAMDTHMNEWGLGIHVIRKLRNRFFHGGLQMPEPDEWSGDESKDVLLFELSIRLTLITIQLLLSREFRRRSIFLQKAWLTLKEGDPAADALRKIHLRNP